VFLVGIICLLCHYDGLYGQDGYAYFYQLTHLDTLLVSNAFYPPCYALTASPIPLLSTPPAHALQMVSLLSWLGTTWIVYHIVCESIANERKPAALIVFLCFFISPFVLRMSTLVMSDALAMFMGTYATYWGLWSKNNKAFFFFFIVAALGVLTRYALGVMLLPVVLFVWIQLLKEKKMESWIYAGTGMAVGSAFLQLWDISHLLGRQFDHQDGIMSYTLPNIIYVLKNIFHPIYTILFVPALLFIQKTDFQNTRTKVMAAAVLGYALFLAGIPFQNDRFLLLSFPLVVMLLYPAVERLYLRFHRFKWAFLMLIPLQLGLAARLLKPIIVQQALEQHIIEALKPFEGQELYTFGVDIAMEGRGLKFQYHNLWKEKYTAFSNHGLVLFNTSKFERQWQGKNPMINWNNLSQNYSLKLLLKLDEGWELYEIENKIGR
jgi:hypothetical protein